MIPPVFGRSRHLPLGAPRLSTLVRAAALLLLPILGPATAFAQTEDHAQGSNAPNLAAAPLGVDINKTPNLTPEQTEAARAIGRELVCLCGTCPREPITDCRCGWAEMNRKIIQLSVQNGKTEAEILGAYQKIYDLKIRPTPPDEGLGKLSYIIPYVAAVSMLGGFLVFGLFMKRKRAPMAAVTGAAHGPGGDAVSAADRAELKKELEDLD